MCRAVPKHLLFYRADECGATVAGNLAHREGSPEHYVNAGKTKHEALTR